MPHEKFQSIFGRHIVERYGMTEVGIVCQIHIQWSAALELVVSAGQIQFKIVDPNGNECERGEVGELLISGPSVISGYWEPTRCDRTYNRKWMVV